MNWYAAHIVMLVKWKGTTQDRFPVWENIVLIQANSEDEAFARAEQRGRQDEGDDGGSFRWDGNPAEWVFAGVRKLTACQDSDDRPGDGTEVTYLELELSSQEALDRFVAGEPVEAKVCDTFPADTPA